MSFMNGTNNNGPIKLPCTTPLESLVMLDTELYRLVFAATQRLVYDYTFH